MCLEDLRLARGQVYGRAITVPDTGATLPFLPSDPSRVALVVSAQTIGLGSIITFIIEGAKGDTWLNISDSVIEPHHLSIYDYGNLITGSIRIGGNGAGNNWSLVEILSTVESSPLTTLANKDKP